MTNNNGDKSITLNVSVLLAEDPRKKAGEYLINSKKAIMGRKQRLSLSAKRKSRKRLLAKRRQEKQNKAQAENAENETNIQLSIKSVPDVNSKVENGILHCVNQVEEEKADDNEKSIEAYEEGSICDGNFEYCKDKDNLVVDNQYVLDNEEKVELYEEHIEVHEEEISTYNENVENCEDQEDLIIDNNCLSDRINSIPKNIPEGRYLVDISFMWNEIHRIFDDHARGIECQFKYWQLVNFRRRGLLTQLFFKCQMCNYEASFWTEPMDSEKSDINAAAAAGCVKVGIGYTQMEKLFTAMNIKYMSEKTYVKNRDHKKTVLKNIETESSEN